MGIVLPPLPPPLPPPLLPLLLLLAPALLRGVPGRAAERAEVLCAGAACYTLHRGKVAWSGAQERCQNNGGNLVAIRSPEEARHVQELLGSSQAGAGWQGKVWIGLSLEKGKCVQSHDPLRGFAWAGGSGEATNYSAWLAEPHTTCLSHRCASLQPAGPSSPAGWADGPCRTPLPGYVCKFSFQGMCGPLALAGPGTVSYTTPFGVQSERLAAAPFGTLAQVTCGAGGRAAQFALCKERQPAGGFAWHPRGPLCAAGCAHRNGGCEQECVEEEEEPGAPPRCACRPGYALGPDLASCAPADACDPNPCEGPCRRLPAGGFECGCAPGYALAPDGRRCLDVDECRGRPCHQECRNTPGGFACACRRGYEPEEPGSPRCRDVDECAAAAAACPQLCLNVPGSFVCACRPGYQRDARQEACVDVDECLRDPCPGGACLNVPGSFRCACPPGFAPAADGGACRPQPPAAEAPTGTPRPTRVPAAALPERPPGSSARPTATTTAATTATATAAAATSTAATGPGAARDAEHAADGPKLLLYYILGSLVAILLLLAFALALMAYRRRKAKEEKQQGKSAADDYCWVPEQAESSAAGGEFR